LLTNPLNRGKSTTTHKTLPRPRPWTMNDEDDDDDETSHTPADGADAVGRSAAASALKP
jgi:hypothetical protein